MKTLSIVFSLLCFACTQADAPNDVDDQALDSSESALSVATTAHPAIVKGQIWFPLYNSARINPIAVRKLGEHIADDVVFYQGLGGTTDKATYLAEATAGAFQNLDVDAFQADELATLKIGGVKHLIMSGSALFTIPAFGMDKVSGDFLNFWRLVDGRWQMVTHMSTFESDASLQTEIDAVIGKLNGQDTGATLGTSVNFTKGGKQHKLVAGAVAKGAGFVDALVLAKKSGSSWHAVSVTARTR